MKVRINSDAAYPVFYIEDFEGGYGDVFDLTEEDVEGFRSAEAEFRKWQEFIQERVDR